MKSTDTLPTTSKSTAMITAEIFTYTYCFAVAGTALFFLIIDPWKGHI